MKDIVKCPSCNGYPARYLSEDGYKQACPECKDKGTINYKNSILKAKKYWSGKKE